ncbi:transcriptional regulator [Vibrio sp. TBV020]|uniref:winged helix-turn-helix domain-containing protein n=1 Tax=Vibrio sp. TBV020 TaxID=3137398 RepID=UPI0038CD4191
MLLINDKYILNVLAGILEERESGVKIALGGNEVALLQFMIEHPQEPLSKAKLLDEVWFKKGVVVEESSLLHAVSTCRKALDDRSGEIITTVRGVGYQFNGSVTPYQPETKQPSSNTENTTDTTTIKRNNTLYLAAFSLSALAAFFVYNAVSSPWVDADYTEQRYLGCVVPTGDDSKPQVLNNVRAFTTGNQVILIDQDGRSVSYIPSEVEVKCE